jgi:hypothetical protein
VLLLNIKINSVDHYWSTRLIFNLIHIPSPFREKVRACPELDSGMRVILNLIINLVKHYYSNTMIFYGFPSPFSRGQALRGNDKIRYVSFP